MHIQTWTKKNYSWCGGADNTRENEINSEMNKSSGDFFPRCSRFFLFALWLPLPLPTLLLLYSFHLSWPIILQSVHNFIFPVRSYSRYVCVAFLLPFMYIPFFTSSSSSFSFSCSLTYLLTHQSNGSF